VLPWLTDSVEHLNHAIGRVAAAGATGITVVPLHLRPGAREWFFGWLEREHPELAPRYRRLYGRSAYATKDYRRWLAARVAPLIRAHGLEVAGAGRPAADQPSSGGGVSGDERSSFPAGSLPGPADLSKQQLTLL
jgi:DNA repair photolyase